MANTTNFTIEKATVGGARNQWGGLLNVAMDKLDELIALALPLGTIQMYTKSTAPTATTNGGTWLICDGSAVSRTTYSALFSLIGTTYGAGDSSSTFNIPDMRARVPVGYNAAALNSGTVNVRSIRSIAATTGGTEGHVLTEPELAAHSHQIPATVHSHDITDDGHAHAGASSGKTEATTLSITDPGHLHTTEMVSSWGGGPDYRPEWGPGPVDSKHDVSSNSATTGISISPASHDHSFTTTTVATGVSVDDGVINITSTAPDTGSNASHNNMQPYLVVQYIILAKHPSF